MSHETELALIEAAKGLAEAQKAFTRAQSALVDAAMAYYGISIGSRVMMAGMEFEVAEVLYAAGTAGLIVAEMDDPRRGNLRKWIKPLVRAYRVRKDGSLGKMTELYAGWHLPGGGHA